MTKDSEKWEWEWVDEDPFEKLLEVATGFYQRPQSAPVHQTRFSGERVHANSQPLQLEKQEQWEAAAASFRKALEFDMASDSEKWVWFDDLVSFEGWSNLRFAKRPPQESGSHTLDGPGTPTDTTTPAIRKSLSPSRLPEWMKLAWTKLQAREG